MRQAAIILLGAGLLGLTPGAGSARPTTPATLTALAGIGTVYWRADCRIPSWSIGIRLFNSATTDVTYLAGSHVEKVELQPRRLHWFPFRRDRLQRLRATQSTEAGTLRATVTIDFGATHGVPHCYAYAPPAFTVTETPR